MTDNLIFTTTGIAIWFIAQYVQKRWDRDAFTTKETLYKELIEELRAEAKDLRGSLFQRLGYQPKAQMERPEVTDTPKREKATSIAPDIFARRDEALRADAEKVKL